MKIGIYNQPSGGGIGGSEFSAAALAEGLADRHEVEIVHHRSGFTADAVALAFGLDASRARFRHVPIEDRPGSAAARSWRSDLSRPYDLFVNFTHGLPPICQAKQGGVLVVLFPESARSSLWPWSDDVGRPASVRRVTRQAYHAWDWARRFASYRTKVAISRYTAGWTGKRWGVDCGVLYPPVDLDIPEGPKTDLILSVGRFTPVKKQHDLIEAFARVGPTLGPRWTYVCAGGAGTSSEDRAYLASVREDATEGGAGVLVDAGRDELRGLLGRSKIFWHGMGYGEDAEADPDRVEHFGISTVEAMAAGSVPVVYARGGPAEIVRHGVDGFHWTTFDDLAGFTARLATDECLRERMARSSQERARSFGKERFVAGFRALVGPSLKEDQSS